METEDEDRDVHYQTCNYGSIGRMVPITGGIQHHNMYLPSPNSTTRSSRSNLLSSSEHRSESYELLAPVSLYAGEKPHSSEIQLPSFGRQGSVEEILYGEPRHISRRRRRLVTLASILATTGLLLWLWSHRDNILSQLRGGKSSSTTLHPPFSILDPVKDLGLHEFMRPDSSTPPLELREGLKNVKSFPTNAWYQNFMMVRDEPQVIHRAYSIPYVVDVAGPIPGLRIHPNHIDASTNVVQLNLVEQFALTLGATKRGNRSDKLSSKFKVTHTTPLGITLQWDSFPMHSTITKGMPFATMRYFDFQPNIEESDPILPTIVAELPLAKNPIVDGILEMQCNSKQSKPVVVMNDIELLFDHSDFTWLVVVSEPILMQCVLDETGGIRFQVLDWAEEPETKRDLVVRVALMNLCSTGINPVYCHQEKMRNSLLIGQGKYGDQLRKHANIFSGPETKFDYFFDDDGETAVMEFDWNTLDMSEIALHPVEKNESIAELLVFALPHHTDIIVQAPPTDHSIYCVGSLVGPACLYEGSKWQLKQTIHPIDFRAPRPPAPWSIPKLAESLKTDMKYKLPSFFRRGAGDTYFSGKMLARLGRIILIAEELLEICDEKSNDDEEYKQACKKSDLPTKAELNKAITNLKQSVEVWIDGTAETPFVYDSAWGGVVSCGCLFNGDEGNCDNEYPNCPAFYDPGLNFGNAFYNDQHFHYGYHILAASIVARFDPEWGRKMYENVLLLVRSIANPSGDDSFFPVFRHKDWYQGHSWASGVAMEYLNGKNQESSSEAIAAYEGVALFGRTMAEAWSKVGSHQNQRTSMEIEKAGILMAATELRSARFYWHIEEHEGLKIYPSEYKPLAIGMLWNTMAQYQTWFGAAPYLASGIQLLPLTPISEYRDDIDWSKRLYDEFSTTCSADPVCTEQGWYILQLAILATVGHPIEASELLQDIPDEVYESAGGNGHSKSNSLWYFATRPSIDSPLQISSKDAKSSNEIPNKSSSNVQVIDCGKPSTCTEFVLDTIADIYSCRQRMDWLMQELGESELDACFQVAGVDFPSLCGGCNPEKQEDLSIRAPICPPCSKEQCNSSLNRCPQYRETFVCTDGPSTGGCSPMPWNVNSDQCQECCELTHCPEHTAAEETTKDYLSCPPCHRDVCRSPINQCPSSLNSQFLCLQGASKGGCSLHHWHTDSDQCTQCCTLLPGCEK